MPVDFRDHARRELNAIKPVFMYKTMFTLKHQNQALGNGGRGGDMIRIFNDKQDKVVSFSARKTGTK